MLNSIMIKKLFEFRAGESRSITSCSGTHWFANVLVSLSMVFTAELDLTI